MDAPHLSGRASCEVTAGVHGQDVIADQQIALLPGEVEGVSSVVEERVNDVADLGALALAHALDDHVGGVKGSLGLGPRLVVPDAGLSGRGMVDDEREAAHLGGVKGAGLDAPGELSKSVHGQVRRQVLEEESGGRKEGEAGVTR